MQTRARGTALTPRSSVQEVLRDHALEVNQWYEKLREADLAKTEEQESNLQEGPTIGDTDIMDTEAQEGNFPEGPTKKLNGWDVARFRRDEVGKRDGVLLALADGDENAFSLALPDWLTPGFNWDTEQCPIDDSDRVTLERGCSLKLDGIVYDIIALDENFDLVDNYIELF